jgi:hypothetical protein
MLIILIAVVLIIYYTIYFVAILINCKEICRKDHTTKIIFGVNQVVHIMFISAMWGGVYSHVYALGGVQIFFIGLANLYVYVLIFLAWPLKVRVQRKYSRDNFSDVAKLPGSETDRARSGISSGRAVEFELEL